MIEIIGLACISILFVSSEPLILLKRYIGFKEEEYDNWSEEKRFIFRLITCVLCSGFWIGLLTFSLYKAAIISILAEYIHKQISRL
jgi:hypothetical protein